MGFDLDQVRQIVEQVAASSGLEGVEMKLRGAGKTKIQRIFIDKPGSERDPLGGVTTRLRRR
jgi:ribosome maturation factor RimP